MFHIASVDLNKFEDFENSLWIDIEKVKQLIDFIKTDNLQKSINEYFNSELQQEKYDLDTLDCLYTRTHIYQIVFGYNNENENYIGSVINYKRKPIKGKILIVKIKIHIDENDTYSYSEDNISINDIIHIIKELFYHTGYHITDKITEFVYDNKYKIKESTVNLTELPEEYHDINIFGIPFRIWYKTAEKNEYIEKTSSYLDDISLFLNKKIREAYITSKIYSERKCLSLNIDIVKQFINIVSNVPDEGELLEITNAYNYANKEVRSNNPYITFTDFYNKIKNYY